MNYNHWSVWDFSGNHNSLMFNTNNWQNCKNNWFTNLGVNYEAIKYSNFALKGGLRLRQSPQFIFWNGINKDRRKKLRLNLFHNGSKAVDGSYSSYNLQFGLTYQSFNSLRISASLEYGINIDKLQYIDNLNVNGATGYLNGE